MSSRQRSRISCRPLSSMMPVQMEEVDFTATRRTTVARAGAKSTGIKFTVDRSSLAMSRAVR